MKKVIVVLLCILSLTMCFCACNQNEEVKDFQKPELSENNVYMQESNKNLSINAKIFDDKFVEISGNSIKTEDYAFDENVLVIKYEYLEKLKSGVHTFNFKTEHNEIAFTVNIKEKEIKEINPDVDIKDGKKVICDENLLLNADLKGSDLVAVEIDGKNYQRKITYLIIMFS